MPVQFPEHSKVSVCVCQGKFGDVKACDKLLGVPQPSQQAFYLLRVPDADKDFGQEKGFLGMARLQCLKGRNQHVFSIGNTTVLYGVLKA